MILYVYAEFANDYANSTVPSPIVGTMGRRFNGCRASCSQKCRLRSFDAI